MLTDDLTREELEAAAEMIVRETLWEAGVEEPPVDAVRVAERMHCVVVGASQTAGRGSRVSRRGGGQVIRLAPEDRPERRQWCVAHELGELLAGRVYHRMAVAPEASAPGAREQIANLLASHLLAPKRWLLPAGLQCDWSLPELKLRFRTASHELIAMRVLQTFPGPLAVTVIDNGSQTWRRATSWRPAPAGEAELETWAQAHESGRPATTERAADGVARVRAWPVHEPDWKREIVFTEYEEP